jgi:hypothetical protein
MAKVVAAGHVPVSVPVPTVTRIYVEETETEHAVAAEVFIEHGPLPER